MAGYLFQSSAPPRDLTIACHVGGVSPFSPSSSPPPLASPLEFMEVNYEKPA